MSAKILYNLSDENPNLNKQFGCMNGILQVFYRQHYPVSGDVEKSLPPGERKDIVGEINMESERETERSTKKKKKKDKHRVSSESSSRPSFSSSPRSSSFSSAEVSTAASQFDQPGENLTREQLNVAPMMMPFDIKELVKGSINREMKTRREETVAFTQQQQPNSGRTSVLLPKEASTRLSSSEWNEGRGMATKFRESPRFSYDEREMRNNGYKTVSKLQETPRLSLDSRGTRNNESHEEPLTMSHRRSNSSVVAKLMGLEVIADNFHTEQRNENRFCDSPRPMSRVEEPTSLQRSRSVGSIKKIPASKFPLEPAPWKQMKAGDSAPSVYGEIQKRLTQLEFKKAGKDLRALKQILESMEKTQQLMDGNKDSTTLTRSTHQPVPAATSPDMNFKPSSILVMKPAAPVSTSLPSVNVGNPRHIRRVTSGKQNAMDLTPRPGLYKGQLDSTKSTSPKTLRSRQALVADSCSMTKSGRSQQQSVSPRRQPKKLGFERQSPPTTPKSEPGKIQRQLGRQQKESASPRRKQEIKPRSTLVQQTDELLSHESSYLRSLRTDSNISLRSNVDVEVTSRRQREKNCDFPELQTPKEFSPIQGSYGMTHQQALAQVTAQAVQANANNMLLPQTDYPPPSSQVSSVQPPQNQTTAPRETSDTTTIIEHRSQQPLNVDKPADDGYNWRKYGQKQVKGSEFPRSYYKCTSQGCPVKKKVERSLDGQVTEIIYKGQHNHEPPQNTKRGNNRDSTANLNGSSVNNNNTSNKTTREQHEAAASQATTEQMSEASDSEEVGNGETGVRKKVEDEPDPKRRSTEVRVTEPAVAAATSHRTVTEPRIIVQTTSEVDLLDDGYRWRKYGQKVVKGNPYPRSYYKCTTQGCGVRKHVERAATDPKAVVTTYEGKHNHDLPASKSSSHSAAAAAHLRLENRPGGSANLNQQQQQQQQPVARLRLKEEQTI